MRTLIKVLVLAMAVAFEATAQTRRTTDIGAPVTGRYSLLGGETVGRDVNVVSGEFGWPSVTFGITHGLSRDTDVGAKFDLLFGVEGATETSQFGIGFRVPYRMVALRSDRLSVLLHVDPGIKLFTYSPAMFGIAFPVGATVGYAVNRDVTAAFGVDVNMTLYLSGPGSQPSFWVSPMFGPAVEFHVDPRLAVGINTRFGPVLPSTGGSSFGFVTQLMLAYRM
jgi:hypothetical protein